MRLEVSADICSHSPKDRGPAAAHGERRQRCFRQSEKVSPEDFSPTLKHSNPQTQTQTQGDTESDQV
ncbi:hypothetical protein ATANTOWER_001011 [Ataeniobius toweri]|uniref:Uncharacterized protein n=1 Tax=Ataeniobius toweri TaxID=208326 RepID=A0ABU7CB72_9TELE|nr:hypothetical protein [Ataeniobius toweri]